MKAPSKVLSALARLYERSQAGRTGLARLDFQPEFEELLAEAGCSEGDAQELAERELRSLDGKVLFLEYAPPPEKRDIYKVRLPVANEAALYELLGRPSPRQTRLAWSALFREAEGYVVREQYAEVWRSFCRARADKAGRWESMGDFRRDDLEGGREVLGLVSRMRGCVRQAGQLQRVRS